MRARKRVSADQSCGAPTGQERSSHDADFCGTKALKDATRERVETFVQQLADAAKKDRDALLCQLNSYARSRQEVAG